MGTQTPELRRTLRHTQCSKRIGFGVCSKLLLGDFVSRQGFGGRRVELQAVDLCLHVAGREVAVDLGGDARVAVAEDEVTGFVAAPEALCGEHVRDMMVQAVDHRFGASIRKLACPIEFLSDNGSIYTSDETRTFGAEIGFAMCNTPPYSPESNGMAESFVKSFKRDYVYLADLWTAADVLRDLPRWFDDYNRVRPHKGLRMLSPVEFRNQQLAS